MADAKITIVGDKELILKLRQFPHVLKPAIEQAGKEYGNIILGTTGVQKYPASGPGNAPPTPYYIRGVGTQYASYNRGNSERYGTRFNLEARGYRTVLTNTASYAGWLGGTMQARRMAAIGWRKLIDVAKENLGAARKIYTGWINYALRRAGLK